MCSIITEHLMIFFFARGFAPRTVQRGAAGASYLTDSATPLRSVPDTSGLQLRLLQRATSSHDDRPSENCRYRAAASDIALRACLTISCPSVFKLPCAHCQ